MSDVSKAAKPKVAVAKQKNVKAKVVQSAKKNTKTPGKKRVGAVKKPLARSTKAKTKVVKVRRTRGPNKPKTSGSFAELLSVQALFEKSKLKARKELKQEYAGILNSAEKIRTQYNELFGESIDSGSTAKRGPRKSKARAKGRGKTAGAKKTVGVKPFTLKEVEGFLEMKEEGIPAKLAGRRSKSIARLEEAFKQTQDAKGILALINQ